MTALQSGGAAADGARLRRLLALASVVVLVDTTFYSALAPLLPFLSREFDMSKGAAGILAAAYPLGTFLGSLPGALAVRKLGVRASVLLGLGLMSASSLAFAFAPSAAALDLARLVQGAAGALSWIGAMGWLVGAGPRERRGALIGSAMGAAIAGALLGPVLGTIAHAVGFELAFSGVALVGVLLMAWTLATPGAPPDPEGGTLAALLRAVRRPDVALPMALVLVPGLIFGTISVLVPLELDRLGATTAAIGATFLVAAGLEAVTSPLAGRLADRRGPFVPVRAGLVGSLLAVLALPFPGTATLLALVAIVTAPLVGLLWAPAMAMLADAGERLGFGPGPVFTLVNLGWAVGQGAGDAGSARLAEATSDATAYVVLAGLTLLALVVVLRRHAPPRPPTGAAAPPRPQRPIA